LKDEDAKSLFYFNCENLSDYKELLEVIQLYLEFKESNQIKKSIIILDEITLPKEWYRAIKSLIDQGLLRDDVVVLTGSSSLAVKREVELFPGRRGKGRDFVLLPLSFRSFLKIFDKELEEKDFQTLPGNRLRKRLIKLSEALSMQDLKRTLMGLHFPLLTINLD